MNKDNWRFCGQTPYICKATSFACCSPLFNVGSCFWTTTLPIMVHVPPVKSLRGHTRVSSPFCTMATSFDLIGSIQYATPDDYSRIVTHVSSWLASVYNRDHCHAAAGRQLHLVSGSAGLGKPPNIWYEWGVEPGGSWEAAVKKRDYYTWLEDDKGHVFTEFALPTLLGLHVVCSLHVCALQYLDAKALIQTYTCRRISSTFRTHQMC